MITIVNKRKHTPTPYDYYIGRPSKLGNPFLIGRDGDRDEVCDKYIEYFNDNLTMIDSNISEGWKEVVRLYRQYGKLNLVCYCYPLRCHGDYIKQVVDYSLEQERGLLEVLSD